MYFAFLAMPSKSGREPILPALGLARFKAAGLTISNRRRSATLLPSKRNCSRKGRSGDRLARKSCTKSADRI